MSIKKQKECGDSKMLTQQKITKGGHFSANFCCERCGTKSYLHIDTNRLTELPSKMQCPCCFYTVRLVGSIPNTFVAHGRRRATLLGDIFSRPNKHTKDRKTENETRKNDKNDHSHMDRANGVRFHEVAERIAKPGDGDSLRSKKKNVPDLEIDISDLEESQL